MDGGLSFHDIKISGGPEVKDNSDVLLLYKIAITKENLEAGKYIESTYNPDIPIRVNINPEVLLGGIYKGVIGMHGGGSVRQICIPPNMAYGDRGFGAIPPGSSLYVEICVVSVDAT